LIAVVLVLAGCDFPGRPRAGDRPVPANQLSDFAMLYGQNCAGCHGANGTLGPAPPLNDLYFLHIVPDAVLRSVIADGRPGTPMPAFSRSRGGPLGEEQVKVLAEGLKPRWGRPQKEMLSVPPYALAEGASGGQSERGARVFARACASCHGERGEGKKQGAGAINNPAFLALISDQALRRVVITGRPDLRMPSYRGKDGRSDQFEPLSGGDIDDLVALLASWRQGEPDRTR
jgi:mono/diheme cytochrome c family protein